MIIQLLVVAILLLLIFVVGIPYIRVRRIYKKYQKDCRFHFFPLIGYFSKFADSKKKYKDQGGFFLSERIPNQKFMLTNLFTNPLIILFDYTLVKEMLLNHQKFFKETNFLFHDLFFTKNLVSVQGEEWKRKKNILSNAMNYNFFKSVYPHISKITQNVINSIESGKPMKIYKQMFKISSQTVSYSFLSKNIDEIKVRDKGLIELIVQTINYSIMQTITFSYNLKSLILPKESSKWGFFLSRTDKHYLQNFKLIKGILENEIFIRLEQLKKGKQQNSYHDFLEFYLKLYIDNPTPELLDEIIQQFYSLLTAGSDTTSALAGGCLYCLAKYPAQYAILQKILNDHPVDIDFETINKISQLTHFIKQVSRFYPGSLDIFPRYVKQEIKIGDFIFPKNTYFGIGIRNIQRNGDIYQNPEQFNPRRWISNTMPSFTYLTFSGGPRSCIGEQLAMLEVKRMIVQFIRSFTVKLNPNTEPIMTITSVYKSEIDQLIIPISK